MIVFDVTNMTKAEMLQKYRCLQGIGLHTRAAELMAAWYREHVYK